MTLQIRNRSSEVLLYEPIGDWLSGITAASFREALNGNDSTDVRINSPGGDVFDGLAMYQAMRDAPNVTTYNDAQAASIASILLLAGDKVVSASHARVMIHNPWTLAAGDADELEAMANQLRNAKESLLGIYAARTTTSEDELSAMMDGETIFTADRARELGFVDEVIEESPRIAASASHWRTLAATPPEVIIKGGKPKLRVQGSEAAFRDAARKFEQYLSDAKASGEVIELPGVNASQIVGSPSTLWRSKSNERRLKLMGEK